MPRPARRASRKSPEGLGLRQSIKWLRKSKPSLVRALMTLRNLIEDKSLAGRFQPAI